MGGVASFFRKSSYSRDSTSMFITAVPDRTSQFANPVINQDFPDPNCIKIKDTYFALATNFGEFEADKSHIQIATSTDLVHWSLRPDALPDLPTWARPGRTWAPNITHVQTDSDSIYVLYFVAWDIQTDLQGLAVATSKNPEGPYQCTASRPFILQVKGHAPCPLAVHALLEAIASGLTGCNPGRYSKADAQECLDVMCSFSCTLTYTFTVPWSVAPHTCYAMFQTLHRPHCIPGRCRWHN